MMIDGVVSQFQSCSQSVSSFPRVVDKNRWIYFFFRNCLLFISELLKNTCNIYMAVYVRLFSRFKFNLAKYNHEQILFVPNKLCWGMGHYLHFHFSWHVRASTEIYVYLFGFGYLCVFVCVFEFTDSQKWYINILFDLYAMYMMYIYVVESL